jgi:hypothetical protein
MLDDRSAFRSTSNVGNNRRITPVSRAAFTLTDRNAFDAAIKIASDWTSEQSGIDLSDDIVTKTDFTLDNDSAVARVSSRRIDFDGGRVWSAAVTFLGDAKIDNREWITDLFVEQRGNGITRFGAQLACGHSISGPTFDHSRPRVIPNILNSLSAEADGVALSSDFETVSWDNFDELVDLLFLQSRRLPILLVSTDEYGHTAVDPARLAKRISGTAHLRLIPYELSYELTRATSKQMSTFLGAVRIYMPSIDRGNPDQFQHPLWLPRTLNDSKRIIGQITDRILPVGFRDRTGDERFWRIGLLREVASRQIADTVSGSELDKSIAANAALIAELENARQDETSAQSLMEEANDKLMIVQAEVERLKQDKSDLRHQVASRTVAKSNSSVTITPSDIKAISDGEHSLERSLRVISAMFADNVVVLESAYNSAAESHKFQKQPKAFDMIWSLCSTYRDALAEGLGDVKARQEFGRDGYSAKESEKLSEAGRRRRTFNYNGTNLFMEKHLKIGVADNLTETLRIHFEWLSDEKKIVIGHCGGHLDF